MGEHFSPQILRDCDDVLDVKFGSKAGKNCGVVA